MMLFAQKEERRPIMVAVFSCIIILGSLIANECLEADSKTESVEES